MGNFKNTAITALALTCGAWLTGTQAAQAQGSAYGCVALATSDVVPSVEGKDGTFFRIEPDLMTHHLMANETVGQIAVLAHRLQEAGTTLIYVPLPTKSQAQPDHLPPLASHIGFDPAMSASVYGETLRRLEAAGVVTVDARHALRAASHRGEAPFYGTDPRLQSAGTQALAQAIADQLRQQPGFDDLPQVAHRTTSLGMVDLFSPMRLQVQEHCSSTLPEVQVPIFETRAQGDSFGTADIALVSSDIAGDPATNLAGFLAEASSRKIDHHTVADPSAFAAMTAYLTSRAYQAKPPRFLVWEVPVWRSLTQFGDRPMRELIAAAGGDCRPVDSMAGGTANSLYAPLEGWKPSDTLMVDGDVVGARQARFKFQGPDGLVRIRTIERPRAQPSSGRFYVPLSGLWPDAETESVDVSLDTDLGATPRLMLCS